MNCKNCGAPIPPNGFCEYCGTDYADVRAKNEIIDFLVDSKVVPKDVLESYGLFETDPNISFEIIRTYNYKTKPAYRDENGRLHRPDPDVVVEKTNIKTKKRIMR